MKYAICLRAAPSSDPRRITRIIVGDLIAAVPLEDYAKGPDDVRDANTLRAAIGAGHKTLILVEWQGHVSKQLFTPSTVYEIAEAIEARQLT